MNLVRATLAVGQHRLRAARPRPRAQERRRHGQGDGHHDQARRLPGRGPRRPQARRVAARDGERVRDARLRRHPQQADRDQAASKFPDGDVEDLGKPQARARALGRRRLRGHEDPEAEHPGGHRDARRTSAARRPARPAPPTTSTTPGSTASRRTWRPRCGSAIPNALREMRSVHGISVAGGTFPAEIWHKFMQVAQGQLLRGLPAAQEPDHLVAVLRQVLRAGARYSGSYGTTTSYGRHLRRRLQRLRPAHLPGSSAAADHACADRPDKGKGNGNGNGEGQRKRRRHGRGTRASAGDAVGAAPDLAAGEKLGGRAVARRAARGARPAGGRSTWRLPSRWRRPGRAVVLATAGRLARLAARPVAGARRCRRRRRRSRGRSSTPACGSRCSPTSPCSHPRARDRTRGSRSARSSPSTSCSCWRRRCSRRTSSATSRTRGSTSCIDLNPYTHSPDAVPVRRRLRVRGLEGRDERLRAAVHDRDLPLAKLGVPVAFWT